MRAAILDLNYTRQEYAGLGATWLRYETDRHGVEVVHPNDAEIVLATVSSQQGFKQARTMLRGIDPSRVVLGGAGCYAPAIFENLAENICVGEGKRSIDALCVGGLQALSQLLSTWRRGGEHSVIPDNEFDWTIPPIRHPDGTTRLFAERGCRHKCLFCQTGWERKHTPNPNLSGLGIASQRLRDDGHAVAIVANDSADAGWLLDSYSEFVSARVDNVVELLRAGLSRAHTHSVRMGIEGVSERLRYAVKKPVETALLISIVRELWQRGIGVTLFFIAGLPGETEHDWVELRELINGLRRADKGCAMLRFHAFVPQPAAPLCVLPLEDVYWERFEEFRRWFFHGPGFTRRVQILAPAQYKGRMARAMESMAATEEQLRRGWFESDNANWRVRYILNPEQMRRVARGYQNELTNGRQTT